MTEITSNTACANILVRKDLREFMLMKNIDTQVPILSRMSVSLCLNPIYLTMTSAVMREDSSGIPQ